MTYKNTEPTVPRVAGRVLWSLSQAMDAPVMGRVVRHGMMLGAGMTRLRKVRLPPELFPQLPPRPTGWDVPWSAPHPQALLRTPNVANGTQGLPSVSDYVHAYREGRCTPLDVARSVIELTQRADRQGPSLRLFIAQDVQDVLAQAQAATARWRQGAPLSVLDGVPVAVKDEVDQLGYPTTVGTRWRHNAYALQDATAVARLREAGAVLVGKANMHELGAGVTGLNRLHGTARNPHHADHHTGGSSSGSAAAVAAGLCPVAVGVDSGGSIRIPASFCGVVGLKPTWGRVSRAGAVPLTQTVTHVGPMARTAEDCALAFAIMAGRDPRDPTSLVQPPLGDTVPDVEHLRGRTLGVFTPWFRDAEAPVVQANDRALRLLEHAGVTLREVRLPDLDVVRLVFMATLGAEVGAYVAQLVPGAMQPTPEVSVGLGLARALSPRDYALAQKHRASLNAKLHAVLEQVDGLVTPTTPVVAPPVRPDAERVGENDATQAAAILRFSVLANISGLPAVSFPVGVTSSGLPIGMQVMGRAWDEMFLLSTAMLAGRQGGIPAAHRRYVPLPA